MFGTESMLGIPMNAFANLVVGFLVFGVALQYTGGGAFFLNLAFALLGRHRGGPAKVAIFGSGLMGSMSGSVITNVLTTGVMTIPAMKRVGFRPAYAAGVEACASTGGVLMPPVMGATAFVMATFLEMSYAEIIMAAAFPRSSIISGLFLQIDAYAARHGLKGLPAAELPPMSQVLRRGLVLHLRVRGADRDAALHAARGAGALLRDRAPAGHQPVLEAASLGPQGRAPLHRGRWLPVRRTARPSRWRRPDHRRPDADRQGRQPHLRTDRARRQLDAASPLHGSPDKLRSRHRHDCYGGLPVPCRHGRPGSHPRRPGQARRSPLHDVLGHDLLHHAAGRDRRLRGSHPSPGPTRCAQASRRCGSAASSISCRSSSC